MGLNPIHSAEYVFMLRLSNFSIQIPMNPYVSSQKYRFIILNQNLSIPRLLEPSTSTRG
jgi:hypothetical protein